ncbi:ABC transporter permease [Paenibacillus koleovorans]|uniref:ABC transporter permease n=1 Tax=Paenibacillus koleovorans TaxID=121608 RepID=UPI000FDCAEB4
MTEHSIANIPNTPIRKRKRNQWKAHMSMYLILLPGLLHLLLFKYVPLYGILIAFKDFNIFDGIGSSPWVGLDNFEKLVSSNEFFRVLKNTVLISVYKIVILFPLPIFVAIVLNEVRKIFFKRVVQTIIYLPHFLSWVIIGGLFVNILSPSSGIVNRIIESLGGEPISFLIDNDWFRSVLVFSAGWKEVGWNAVVFIAAIAGIDQDLYEAADIDGAGRINQIIHITLPSIASTIVLMLILRLGYVLEAGTEQILVMYNSVVYETADVIGTYVYRIGLGTMDYSFSTAVGLFNSVVGFALVVTGNKVCQKLTQKSIW